MQHRGSCTVREAMTLMRPRSNAVESRIMPTFDHFSSTLLLSSSTRLWHQKVKPHMCFFLKRWNLIEAGCIHLFVFNDFQERRLSTVLSKWVPTLVLAFLMIHHQHSLYFFSAICAAETWIFSKQRLPATAQSPARETARERLRVNLWTNP